MGSLTWNQSALCPAHLEPVGQLLRRLSGDLGAPPPQLGERHHHGALVSFRLKHPEQAAGSRGHQGLGAAARHRALRHAAYGLL